MKLSVKPIEGRTQDQNESQALKDLLALPVTGDSVGIVRRALHVAPFGYFEVAASVAVEAGSTETTVIVTGHGHKKGDVLRFLATVNPIEEIEAVVEKVIDANTFHDDFFKSKSHNIKRTMDFRHRHHDQLAMYPA